MFFRTVVQSARIAFALIAFASTVPVAAKPIAYAGGQTLMYEHGGESMQELQWFYAPSYRWSVGGGLLELTGPDGIVSRELGYARVNWLARRWNLPAAQGNVFLWGGLAAVNGDAHDSTAAWNAGFQVDYETRRVYGSFKSDAFDGTGFTRRSDTLQLGLAPYLHDWDRLATWFVYQARADHGDLADDGIESALILRLFKGGTWVELGVNDDHQAQLMFMFNF